MTWTVAWKPTENNFYEFALSIDGELASEYEGISVSLTASDLRSLAATANEIADRLELSA